MLVVGLTGGIGSGKTIVAKLFSENGVPIIDADNIARQITQPDQPAYVDIVRHFGKDILLANGSLNRSHLRHVIFTDPKHRLWLEKLLHPIIRQKMEEQIKNLTTPYCIAIIPLLFEVEFYSFINRTLVVDAPQHLQVSRVMSRDQVPQSHVEAILQTQANRESRLARAQDVIVNDGNINDLIPQVEKLHEKYSKIGSSLQ